MQIIREMTEFEIQGESAAAIGKFDGIHLGHQKLLDRLLAQKSKGLKAVVFTFNPPPAVLFKKEVNRELMTEEEKRAAFEKMGIDVLIEFPLTMETAAMSPKTFIEEILIKSLHVSYIAAGTDVSFGAKGAGNYELLEEMSKSAGYQVEIIPKVCYRQREVSSTYVRETIERGEMEEAAALLGEPYRISGKIVHGNHFGRTLGMPTVNLLPEKNKLLPPNGVYYSRVLVDGVWHDGITNIGYKPTVSEEKRLGVETYLYGFDKEIYGKEIQTMLLKFKRAEQKFEGTEELKTQMAADIRDGAAFHGILP